MAIPYTLVTKEEATRLLSVSKRTIDNWIADGTLPKPIAVGRRVYWHPELFRVWQDSLFGASGSTPTPPASVGISNPPAARRAGRPRTSFTG